MTAEEPPLSELVGAGSASWLTAVSASIFRVALNHCHSNVACGTLSNGLSSCKVADKSAANFQRRNCVW